MPIDWAKQLQFPMYGNDRLGDCMWAAAGHGQGTFTGNVGTEIIFDETALEDQYMQLSGGDNGLDEGTLIQGWTAGMNGAPAGSAKQCIVDALDIDPTNATMCQTAIQYFGGILFMLDVPDAWINNFTGNGGDVWDAPARADANNGHGVWWNGVDTNGRYKLQTWGSWVWITPAGVAACDPSAIVVFSPNWFDPKTGYAPNGLHITQLAAIWQQAGGTAIPQSVIAAFPPPNPSPSPTPTPTPPVTGVTITLTPDQVSAVVNQAGAVALTAEQLKAIQTLQGIVLPSKPSQRRNEEQKKSGRADEPPTRSEPISLPQSRSAPANAGPWPLDLEFPDGLQRYSRARFTQAIYTLNNRPAIDAVPITSTASKWHQPGGMEGISGLYKFIPGGRTWVGGIPLKNSFGFFQTERGHNAPMTTAPCSSMP